MKIQRSFYLSLQVVLILIGISLTACKSQEWAKPKTSSKTSSKKNTETGDLNRLVYRSTLNWGVKVYKNEQEFLELYKPMHLVFSQKAKFTIQLFQDTLKEVKVLNGQDMPVMHTIQPLNSDTVSFNLDEYFCLEKFGRKLDRLYIIFYTKVGHTQSLRVDIKNNDRKLICD